MLVQRGLGSPGRCGAGPRRRGVAPRRSGVAPPGRTHHSVAGPAHVDVARPLSECGGVRTADAL